MTADNFLNTALQYGKERKFSELSQFTLDQLRSRRKQTLPQIANLISHTNDGMRDALFSALTQDGGADTLVLLMQIFQVSHDPLATEKRLERLSQHENPEVLDLVDALEPILPPGLKRSFHKAQSVVRARFRTRFLLRSFASAEGKQLTDLANTMMRSPHVDFLALFEQLPSQLNHCREALRVLRSIPQPGAMRLIIPTLMRFLEREQNLSRFASMPLPASSDVLTPQQLLNGLVADQLHPLTKQAMEKLLISCQNKTERIDPGQLIAPYGLKGATQFKARQLVERVLASGETAPSPAQFQAELKHWQEEDTEMLCLFLFSVAQIAVKLEDASFADQLLAKIRHDEARRTRLQIWIFAGLADDDSIQKLLQLLGQNPGEMLTRELLRALAEVSLDPIPDAVMLLALDGNRHPLRMAALDFLARSSQGQAHLEHLLAHAPLVIKEDVSATIVRHHLKACVPALLGLLNGRITDSFRLIILATLEHFESEDIGRPICTFLMSGQTLPVRLAALQALMRAGGPQRLEMILETISGDEGKRHRAELASAFLTNLADKDPLFFEDKLLLQRKFLEEMLHFPTPAVRLQTLDLMERMSWETDAREGWVGLLQRVLQTLVGQRQPAELERLRKLIDTLSARFDSERKRQVLHRRVITISNGLEHQLRLERIQALRQLDWIFSPEMVAGDPKGVKRLALRIERMLEHDAGDTPIEVLALEVAGKIGHPTLHKKIKEYLSHSEAEVVSAARRALRHPVNPILLENLIKTVFHIDDSGYITRLAGSILTQEGYTAVAATDPDRAVELLRQDDYDLLLLDLNMPRMRGYDFLCMIRRMGIAPRYTFVLTSVRTHEDLVEVFKEGVDGVLLKPFQAEELVQKIGEIRERAI